MTDVLPDDNTHWIRLRRAWSWEGLDSADTKRLIQLPASPEALKGSSQFRLSRTFHRPETDASILLVLQSVSGLARLWLNDQQLKFSPEDNQESQEKSRIDRKTIDLTQRLTNPGLQKLILEVDPQAISRADEGWGQIALVIAETNS